MGTTVKHDGHQRLCRNADDGRLLLRRVHHATDVWPRTKGLLGRRTMPPDEGLWIDPCRAIHTMGMAFTIDLVWLDADCRVVGTTRGVPPWRPLVRGPRGTRSVIEVAAGSDVLDAVAAGDRLAFEPEDAPTGE